MRNQQPDKSDGKRGLIVTLSTLTLSLIAIALVATDYFSIQPGVLVKQTDAVSTEASINNGLTFNDEQYKLIEKRLNELTLMLAHTHQKVPDQESAEKIKLLEAQMAELLAQRANEDAERRASRSEMANLQEAANDPYLRQQFAKANALHRKRQLEAVEELFVAEDIDPKWGLQTQDRLEQSLAENEDFFAQIVDMQCRTSVCRVDVAVPPETLPPEGEELQESSAAQLDTDISLLSSVTLDMPTAFMSRMPDGTGGYSYRFYLYREGYDSPQVPHPMKGMSLGDIRNYLENL
jgi:hypothetical protein